MRTVRAKIVLATIPLAALTLSLNPGVAQADNGTSTTALRDAVSVEGVMSHLETLQKIAEENSDNRAAGTGGHEASADYVGGLLAAAGYVVWEQPFSYKQFVELPGSPTLERTKPDPGEVYTPDVDFATMSYSGSGSPGGMLQPVDLQLPPTGGSTSGCEPADFSGFTAGGIALIQRGTCTFAQKALNAQDAGATGVIVFNEGNSPDREDVLFGTLGGDDEFTIPVVGTSFAIGVALAEPGAEVELFVNATTRTIDTYNVLADTPGGRSDRIVVAGGHLDSVSEGPGIEDNGTGTAATLEVALQMADLGITPRNKVRFAFWSGEEDGLLGSAHYVSELTARELKSHALNLNFDMIGSPNFVRFIYDGDGSATGTSGPNGSATIEKVFTEYFAGEGLATEETEFDGRSDYGPFIDAGIPAGGLFTGAEDLKTDEEADIYGGYAGKPYDGCYHRACDDIDNVSEDALDQMSDAVAHSVLTFAMTTSAVNGSAQGNGGGAGDAMDRKGARFFK